MKEPTVSLLPLTETREEDAKSKQRVTNITSALDIADRFLVTERKVPPPRHVGKKR